MSHAPCYALLTCDAKDVDPIVSAVLEDRLALCVKRFPVMATYRFEGEIESATEVLLLMETRESLFLALEARIGEIHSYDTFVLTQVPITALNASAQVWFNEELPTT